jgi:hypothetical protein
MMPSEIDLFSTRYVRGTDTVENRLCSTASGLCPALAVGNVRLYCSVTTCTYHCRGEYIQLVRPVQNKRACVPICFNQELENRGKEFISINTEQCTVVGKNCKRKGQRTYEPALNRHHQQQHRRRRPSISSSSSLGPAGDDEQGRASCSRSTCCLCSKTTR